MLGMPFRLAAIAILVAGFALCGNADGADKVIRSHGIEVHFLGHTAERAYKAHYLRETWSQLYSAVEIQSRSGAVHRLKADPEYGLFVAASELTISPDGKYLVLEQLLGGYAEDDEHRWWHEVDHCVFIETDTARLVTRETEGYCGGEFSAPDVWTSINGDLNLATLGQ